MALKYRVVPFTTVFFQRHTAPTKNGRFKKILHLQVGNGLTFMWVLFVATLIDLNNGKSCIKL